MICMLDTNICVELIRKRSEILLHRLTSFVPGEVGISSITLAELEFGVRKSAQPEKNSAAIREFVTPLIVAPFDWDAAAHYGRIRSHLESTGQIIGGLDMLIAAHARSLDVSLVTWNTKEFRRVPNLTVEDWLDA